MAWNRIQAARLLSDMEAALAHVASRGRRQQAKRDSR